LTKGAPSDRLSAARAGSRRDLARLLTDVEDGRLSASDLFEADRPVGRSIAITGPPGVGKSCFIDHLLRAHASEGEPIALLAVDPSSALSGGALLGDRIRLSSPDDEALSERIYVRSIATRRSSGSIPSVLGDLVQVLHGCGWPLVIIETVGAGQSEVRCAAVADRIVLMEGPARGDGVQAEKAGLLELADLVLVNKADLEGAERHAAELRESLALDGPDPADVLLMSAQTGLGLSEALTALRTLEARPGSERARARERLANAAEARLVGHEDYEVILARIANGTLAPEDAVEVIWRGE